MTQPTRQEQEMLYYINRIRTNPVAELDLLLNAGDSDIDNALNFFGVRRNRLRNQFNRLNSVAPLAWSDQLTNAATTHTDLMIQFDEQAHDLPNEPSLGVRITDADYEWNKVGENVFAFAKSILHGHAGFVIDWGDDNDNPDDGFGTGIQSPPGHRNIIMDGDFREIGIGIKPDNDENTDVGPLVITQNFANRNAIDNQGWLVGTVFKDVDGDDAYGSEEGLADVTVEIEGVNGTDYSENLNVWKTGGYQILLNPGEYQIKFKRDNNIIDTRNTVINAGENILENLEIDLAVAPQPGLGKITGFIFRDTNDNGIWDDNELGLEGQTVYLDANRNRQLDNGEQSTTSDEIGAYFFNDLNPGDYSVMQVLNPDFPQTFPDPDNPPIGSEVYQLDDGESNGWASFGPTGASSNDQMIFNSFEVISGSETINSISLFLSERGNPSKLFIYQDADNDDQPDGNEKILEINPNLTGSNQFTTVEITPTTVSGTFFVAALYQENFIDDGNTWVPIDSDNPRNQSWIAPLATNGTFNPNSFSVFPTSDYNWLLRANSPGLSGQIVTLEEDQTVSQINFGNFVVNNDPVVANEIANQTATQNTAFSFTIPGNTFIDQDGDILTYNATLQDGSDLPNWLIFDGNTFSGTPDHNDLGTISVQVTADDSQGGTVNDVFDLTVNSAINPDFNLDGKRDLVWRNQVTGINAVWYMDGNIRTGFDYLNSVSDTNWQIVGTGDANGDQKTDLYWRNQATGRNVLWYMDGTTRTDYDELLSVNDPNWQVVGIGDADNDSLVDDLYWRNQATGKNVVWYMDEATRTDYDELLSVNNPNWEIVSIGDGDNDGVLDDLYWRNNVTGRNVIWYMDEANRIGTDQLPTVTNTDWQIVGTGDGNGDQNPDIYWRHQATGQNVLWYMNGANRIGTDQLTTVANSNWQIVG